MKEPRYFLGNKLLGEKEVTKEQFIGAETAAGLYSKSGPGTCATGGFGGGGEYSMGGRIDYSDPVPPVVDLSQADWESIQQAASDSPWMPKEYMQNDWVSDVCSFLRDPRPDAELEATKGRVRNLSMEVWRVRAANALGLDHEKATWATIVGKLESTPSSRWKAAGEVDPHAGHYDGERSQLTLGKLSDDELANAAFMGYDGALDISRILDRDPNYHAPIALMTAVKDRIRWLSRKLEEATSKQ